MEDNTANTSNDENIDPLNDIIDYLVRCAKISFKNSHVDEIEVRTADKVRYAHELYEQSPVNFLIMFGKHLTLHHLKYFEEIKCNNPKFRNCIKDLKIYHSDVVKHKRVRNRRYKALQKLQAETDYFTEKEMMYRNPLLYEQLVGQYLNDDEVKERDGVDSENLTFLNMILETVDRNEMREKKNLQEFEEGCNHNIKCLKSNEGTDTTKAKQSTTKQWGSFDEPDTRPSFVPQTRKQSMISAPERKILRQEFFHEMFSSFIEGNDPDIDYNSIDLNEQFDDLQQLERDAEDKYFDSESNEQNTLEEHMKLVEEYGTNSSEQNQQGGDPLDEFMNHLCKKSL